MLRAWLMQHHKWPETRATSFLGDRWVALGEWNDSFTTSLKVINLFDQEIQQHIFGDVMRRQVVLELRMRVGTKP